MRFLTWVLVAVIFSGGTAMAYWCIDGDEFWTTVAGSSVTFHHDGALYNCCPNPFEYETYWEGGQLVVVEEEILVNGCWCQCCYDLSITIDDFDPGDHTVLFRWFDEETNNWSEVELTFTVPNTIDPSLDPLPDKVQVGDFWQSECLETPSSVPDDNIPPGPTWGALKAMYQ